MQTLPVLAGLCLGVLVACGGADAARDAAMAVDASDTQAVTEVAAPPDGADAADVPEAGDAEVVPEAGDAEVVPDAGDAEVVPEAGDVGPIVDRPFSRTCIEQVAVALDPADVERFRAVSGDAVRALRAPATVTFTSCDGSTLTVAAEFRLKGRGSNPEIDAKSSFKLSFAALPAAERPFGEERLTFDNLDDVPFIGQALASDLFAALGVAAPRVGFAEVALAGTPRGLYAIVETPGADFCARAFASTSQLIEVAGGPLDESLPPEALDFEVGPADPTALLAITPAVLAAPDLLNDTAARIDWDQVLKVAAAELLVGQTDGFLFLHHYFAHLDADGRLSIVPWAFDEAHGPTAYDDVALVNQPLMARCVRDAACAERAWTNLADAAQRVRDVIVPAAERLVDLTLDAAARDPLLAPQLLPDDARALAFLDGVDDRLHALETRMRCRVAPTFATDAQGVLCGACGDFGVAVHPGLADTCGDGIDQDCSGRADDADACDDCVPFGPAFHPSWTCWRPRTFDAARAKCASLGADLMVPNTSAEFRTAGDRASLAALGGPWIGLTTDAAGLITGIDGSPWVLGPSNAGLADQCVFILGNGLGFAPCDQPRASVCEATCAADQDDDHDGFLACGDDCNDDAAGIHPGASEPQCAGDLDCDGFGICPF